jgi:hypothetical protein
MNFENKHEVMAEDQEQEYHLTADAPYTTGDVKKAESLPTSFSGIGEGDHSASDEVG